MDLVKKILFFIFIVPSFIFSINYQVKFLNIKDKNILQDIQSVSALVNLQKQPLKTLNSLKFRANNDIAQIKDIYHAYGYFDANVSIEIEERKNIVIVNVYVYPNVRYLIKNVNLYSDEIEKKKIASLENYEKDLDLKEGSFYSSFKIIDSLQKLKFLLSSSGYPLAKIEKKDVFVNTVDKTVTIDFYVDLNSYCKFGPVKISGLKNINKSYVYKKIKWNIAQTYDERKIIETRSALLKTNLFSSVNIYPDKTPTKDDLLNMNIKFIEALHKYFNTGISYATIDGFGGAFGLGNRNFRSEGEFLGFETQIAQRHFSAIATYKKFDFLKIDQNYVSRLDAEIEKIPSVYLAHKYMFSNRIDRKFSKNFAASFGFKMEYVDVTDSGNDGKFFLLYLPFYTKYSTANNLLNPTTGTTIIYRAIPFQNTINSARFFFKQFLTHNLYLPLGKKQILVLAFRTSLGSIAGANENQIPLTKLFLGGSDDDLRGYKYRTVSPLNYENKPIGGRSAIYFTIEPRFRLTQTIGIVPFLDLGTVSLKKIPDFTDKWYKSVGIGGRYFSFFGPIRFDIGFPLNKRKKIDSSYKIYVSVGQTF